MLNSLNEAVPVVIVSGGRDLGLPQPDEQKIREIVRERVLSHRPEPYRKVQIEVERGSDNRPVALLASLLRANTYTADVVKLHVDPNYNVSSIESVS